MPRDFAPAPIPPPKLGALQSMKALSTPPSTPGAPTQTVSSAHLIPPTRFLSRDQLSHLLLQQEMYVQLIY